MPENRRLLYSTPVLTSTFEQCFGRCSRPGDTPPAPGTIAPDCCGKFPPRLVAPETPPLRDAAAAAGPPLRQTRAPCVRNENGPGRVPPNSALRSSRSEEHTSELQSPFLI